MLTKPPAKDASETFGEPRGINETYMALYCASQDYAAVDPLRGFTIVSGRTLESASEYGLGLSLFLTARKRSTVYLCERSQARQIQINFNSLAPANGSLYFKVIVFRDFDHLNSEIENMRRSGMRRYLNLIVDSVDSLRILDSRYDQAGRLIDSTKGFYRARRRRIFLLGSEQHLQTTIHGINRIEVPSGILTCS